jgi:hypothetical protein
MPLKIPTAVINIFTETQTNIEKKILRTYNICDVCLCRFSLFCKLHYCASRKGSGCTGANHSLKPQIYCNACNCFHRFKCGFLCKRTVLKSTDKWGNLSVVWAVLLLFISLLNGILYTVVSELTQSVTRALRKALCLRRSYKICFVCNVDLTREKIGIQVTHEGYRNV